MARQPKGEKPRSEDALLNEAGYALAQPEADDLLEAVGRGELDRAMAILKRKPQYFSPEEVEILLQRLVRDEKTDSERYPKLVTLMEILHEPEIFRAIHDGKLRAAESLMDLVNSPEAPKAIGRLKRERVWRRDEIVPWVTKMIAVAGVMKIAFGDP